MEAIKGGADIIDIKNPLEGPLGASSPWIIRRIRKATPPHIEVSCTLGDLPNLPGTAALAALGAATLGVNYIKTGLCGLKDREQVINVMRNVARAVREFDTSIKVVVAGYADAERVSSLNPLAIPEIASETECDFAMLDTAIKDGKNLFDFLSTSQIQSFISEAHNRELHVALAGSLKMENLALLCKLGADVVGLRSAACTSGDRINGRITSENVRAIAQTVRAAEQQVK